MKTQRVIHIIGVVIICIFLCCCQGGGIFALILFIGFIAYCAEGERIVYKEINAYRRHQLLTHYNYNPSFVEYCRKNKKNDLLEDYMKQFEDIKEDLIKFGLY